jgi:hypothetical protein
MKTLLAVADEVRLASDDTLQTDKTVAEIGGLAPAR